MLAFVRSSVVYLSLFIVFLACNYNHGFLIPTPLSGIFPWLKFSTYGIMMAGGFLTANYLLQKEFERLGYPVKLADNIVIGLAVGGIVGAKLFYLWESSAEWSGIAEFSDRLFSGGGLTWYGGLVVAGIVLYVLLRREGLKFFRITDIGTPALALGYVFGRLGCLFSGDGCYGEKCPYDWPAPLAMAFPNGAAPWSEIVKMYNDENVRVYNTPLFEATLSFLLFLFFYLNRKREWPLGIKTVVFLIVHSTFRFFIEFIRLNPRDIFGLSQAQFVSLVIIVISIGYIVKNLNMITTYIREGANVGSGNK